MGVLRAMSTRKTPLSKKLTAEGAEEIKKWVFCERTPLAKYPQNKSFT
jgi:hypothetical protein